MCQTNRVFDRATGLVALLIVASVQRPVRADVVLNPSTYTSPNGSYRLEVNPSHADGSGPGHHTLTHDGEVLWEADLEYTLWDAEVGNSGVVAGFAYANGFDGRQFRGRGAPELVVAILNRDGSERMRDVRPRRHSGVLSTPPSPFIPLIDEVLLDEQHDRFIVQESATLGDPNCHWWTYELSSGAKIGDRTPAQPAHRQIGFHTTLHAECVPGKPLVAVHWHVYRSNNRDARLALLSLDGKDIWHYDIPGEYDVLDDRAQWWMRRGGAPQQLIVGSDRITFRSYKQKQQITFAIAPDPNSESGWSVTEADRVADDLPPPTSPGPTLEPVRDMQQVTLERLEDIRLEATGEPPPMMTGILNFAIDAKGRIGFMRHRGSAKPVSFVLVTDEGKVVVETDIDSPDRATTPIAGVTGGGRWFVLRGSYADGASNSDAWWVNVDNGTLTAVDGGVAIQRPDSVAPVVGGGFAVSGSDAAAVFDEHATLRHWIDIRLPNSIAPRPNGGVVVLTAVPCIAHLFDSAGNPAGSVNLSERLSEQWCFGSIWTDHGGNLLLEHNGRPERLYRVSVTGEVLDRLKVSFADGRTFDLDRGVRSDPQGRLWTSDGYALMRLDDNGTVRQVLGPKPQQNSLERIRHLTAGPHGRIYALNDRTNAVHVFEPDGALLRVLTPDPEDFGAGSKAGPIAVAADGSVFVGHTTHAMNSSYRYLEFGPDGARRGFASLGLDATHEQWIFQGDTRRRWVVGYKAVFLVDADSETVAEIRRRPDRCWLESIHDASAAPNGSLLVRSGPTGPWMFDTDGWLSIYSANGAGVASMPMPESGRIAWFGRFAILATRDELLILDTAGRPWRRADIGGDDRTWWQPVIPPNRNELWLWQADSMSIRRYRLPM